MTTTTTSPTEITYFADHDSDALRSIVARYTADSAYMFTRGSETMAAEAMKIANAAWGQLVVRGEA